MTDGFAAYEEDYGRATVTFERALAQPPAEVWPALTEPAQLAHWFPAAVEADWRAGGVIRFGPEGQEAGEITEFEPARRLTFTWGKAILRFELEPVGAGTRLHLVQLLASAGHAASDAAGWHAALDRLAAHVGGAVTSAPGPEWQALYDAYAARGFPAAAG